ncbi:hypothetical protein [Sphingobacterium faecium]|uniref:baeRF3 domain-containing protein n=1 Tax=Sphingobacterium faecium TaxID=34087 RepID=UPI00320848EC
MKINTDLEASKVMDAIHAHPALSIVLPIEARISLKTEMNHLLKITADKAARELQDHYPKEQCEVVMKRLYALIANLDIPPKKKGMVLYVSPLFAKVIYLDFPVVERLVIDESFEIRDLFYNAKQQVNFILLVISAKKCQVYLGDCTSLIPAQSHVPKSVHAFINDSSERVGNFSDIIEHNQIIVDKFLIHIDDSLGKLINQHHLPVLLLGAEGILGQFKKLSKHTEWFMDSVAGNYERATIPRLLEIIAPSLHHWKIARQQKLLDQLDQAAAQDRLAYGIIDVWKEVQRIKGKLLMVEKSYHFIAQHGSDPSIIAPAIEPYDHSIYIHDAVDDVIEKLLTSGGDVEFVDDGVLEHYEHIALIKFYP